MIIQNQERPKNTTSPLIQTSCHLQGKTQADSSIQIALPKAMISHQMGKINNVTVIFQNFTFLTKQA